LQNTEDRIVTLENTSNTQPADKRQLFEAFNHRLDQLDANQTAIPRDMTRATFKTPTTDRTPQPLGIPWLDSMLGGGLVAGEVFLFLGPSGGGKTTLATQIAWSRAMQRSHTTYITYDEPLEGYIENRFYSLMTGVPRPEFETKALADMSPAVQRRFQAWREAYGRFLHVHDGSSARHGKGGIEDVAKTIMDESNEGRRPDLVIVDWVQCAVLKGMGTDGRSAREIAVQMDRYAEQFAALCKSQGIQGILVQQLAATYQRARNIALDHKMAEACSTLGDHCQHAVAIGRLTPEGEGLMISSKGMIPVSQRPPQAVRLNGAFNRFETPRDLTHDQQVGQSATEFSAPLPTRTDISAADHGDQRPTHTIATRMGLASYCLPGLISGCGTALSLTQFHPMIAVTQPVPSPPAQGKYMTTGPYDYRPIAEHPKLLIFYSGWIGQKVCFLTHSAVTCDRSDLWLDAAAEVDRLALVLRTAEKAKMLRLSDETKTAFGELIGYYAAGGWWTSSDGTRERMAYHQEQRELDQFSEDDVEPDEVTFSPRLALEDNPSYSIATTAINALDATVRQAAIAMGDLDVCRLGTLLSGFGHRVTPRLHVQFVNSILDDLAAHDITDLDAENEFRRAVGLSEVSADRRPRSVTDPASGLRPFASEDFTADRNGRDPFTSYVEDLTGHRDAVLACVFRRFGVTLPPAESNTPSHPELAGFKKKKLQAAPRKAMKSQGKKSLAEQTAFWAEEAIVYLGLDRRDLKRPDMALQRLIKKGALRPTKIGGRLVFKKEDLDRVREKGDEARRRGRPRNEAK